MKHISDEGLTIQNSLKLLFISMNPSSQILYDAVRLLLTSNLPLTTTCENHHLIILLAADLSRSYMHEVLRLVCSPPNYDLHRKSIVNYPLWICGSVEAVKQLLFERDRYNRIRTDRLSTLQCHPSSDNLLRENSRRTPEQNITIVFNTQTYILASKWFT